MQRELNTRFEGKELNSMKARNRAYENHSFRDALLTGMIFSSSTFTGSDFSASYLIEVNFTSANLTETTFNGVRVSGSNMTNAILIRAHLTDVNFSGVDMSGANLSQAVLTKVTFSGHCCFAGVNLYGAILEDVIFEGSGNNEDSICLKDVLDLLSQTGISIKGEIICGEELKVTSDDIDRLASLAPDIRCKIRLQKPLFWGNIRNAQLLKEVHVTEPSFTNNDDRNGQQKVNFSGLNWSEINLTMEDCTGADFSYAILDDGIFDSAKLKNACFIGARLRGACFYDTGELDGLFKATGKNPYEWFEKKKWCLVDVNFQDADLTGAIFSSVVFKKAVNLRGANLCDAIFEDCDLEGAVIDKTTNLDGVTLANVHIPEKLKKHINETYDRVKNKDGETVLRRKANVPPYLPPAQSAVISVIAVTTTTTTTTTATTKPAEQEICPVQNSRNCNTTTTSKQKRESRKKTKTYQKTQADEKSTQAHKPVDITQSLRLRIRELGIPKQEILAEKTEELFKASKESEAVAKECAESLSMLQNTSGVSYMEDYIADMAKTSKKILSLCEDCAKRDEQYRDEYNKLKTLFEEKKKKTEGTAKELEKTQAELRSIKSQIDELNKTYLNSQNEANDEIKSLYNHLTRLQIKFDDQLKKLMKKQEDEDRISEQERKKQTEAYLQELAKNLQKKQWQDKKQQVSKKQIPGYTSKPVKKDLAKQPCSTATTSKILPQSKTTTTAALLGKSLSGILNTNDAQQTSVTTTPASESVYINTLFAQPITE